MGLFMSVRRVCIDVPGGKGSVPSIGAKNAPVLPRMGAAASVSDAAMALIMLPAMSSNPTSNTHRAGVLRCFVFITGSLSSQGVSTGLHDSLYYICTTHANHTPPNSL